MQRYQIFKIFILSEMQGKSTDDFFHFFSHADELFLYLEEAIIFTC